MHCPPAICRHQQHRSKTNKLFYQLTVILFNRLLTISSSNSILCLLPSTVYLKPLNIPAKAPTQPTESVQNTKPTIRDNHDPRPYGRVISTTRPQKPRTNQPVRTNLSLMPYRPCTSSMQQMNVNPNPVPYEYVGFRNDAANSNECIFFCFFTKRTTRPRFNSRGEKRETKPPPLLVQLFKRA